MHFKQKNTCKLKLKLKLNLLRTRLAYKNNKHSDERKVKISGLKLRREMASFSVQIWQFVVMIIRQISWSWCVYVVSNRVYREISIFAELAHLSFPRLEGSAG